MDTQVNLPVDYLAAQNCRPWYVWTPIDDIIDLIAMLIPREASHTQLTDHNSEGVHNRR